MSSGLIRDVFATPANIADTQGVKYICPNDAMIFADKGYCVGEAQEIFQQRNCHNGAIKKNNMHGKNKDKDRWISGIRSPFEGVFAKINNRAKYRGLEKVKFQVILDAIIFNVKRLVTIGSEPLFDYSTYISY